MATTSSGLTLKLGSLPKNSLTFCKTKGMRVIPPTIMTSLISSSLKPESAKAFLQGSMVLFTKSPTNDSKLARVSFITKCFGPF